MQFSRFTDYSLRVLFYVATHNDRLTTLSEIASFYGISVEHLRKVVHHLSKSGYLQTFRGKNGGIRLAHTPEEINIGEVVIQTEGDTPMVDCFAQDCRLTPCCTLQGMFKEAQEAFYAVLKRYTLAQALNNPTLRSQLIVTTQDSA